MFRSVRPWVAKACLLFLVLWLPFLPWNGQEARTARAMQPPDPPAGSDPTGPGGDLANPMAQQLLEEINRVRWELRQLPPLKANSALESAALGHCRSMAEQEFFGHRGFDHSSPWDRINASGYDHWTLLAENIAAGYASAEDVVQAWLASPLHRETLLHRELCEAGVGYVYEPGDAYPGDAWGYEHYWTLDLGAREGVFPLIIEREAYSATQPTVDLYVYGQGWAEEMRLSNDGVTWSEWQPFQAECRWTLSPGSGTRSVTVQLRNARGEQTEAADEIVLLPPSPSQNAPTLRVHPEQLIFGIEQGGRIILPGQQRLELSYEGEGIRTWYVSEDQAWLRLNRSAGVAPGEIVLALTDQAALLAPGTYTATVSIQWQGNHLHVPVRLRVYSQVYSCCLPTLWIHP